MLGRTELERIIVCPMGGVLPPVKGLLFSLFKRSELAHIPKDSQHIPYSDLIDNDGAFTPVTITPNTDLAVLQYTGGTTGLPKGAMLTHANLTANVDQLLDWIPDFRPGQESLLCVLPFFHVFAMSVLLNCGVARAAELILLPRFELDQALKTISRKKPTMIPGVPTLFTAINNAPDLGKYDLSSIRYCISGGAPLPVEVKLRFEELTGCVLVEGYGLSEASPVATCNPFTGLNKPGAIGKPLAETEIEIRSLDDFTQLVPDGQKGEVCIRGPQVMAGYWNRPDATAETLVDGLLRTGDVGYRDEDGYIHLVDRLKDLIICSGFNVYPRAIEEALYLHPSVAEAVVIGIDDPYRGQAPKAFVRLKDGAEPVDGAALRDFLRDKVSRIEMPREVEIRDELPKTLVGKLSKKELVAEERAKAKDSQPAA